jgi:outer membrane protein assembly factor BamB
MELGTSPSPRQLIVAESWVYVLNPATDEIRGLPLQEDGIVPATEAPTPILRGGQTVAGSPEPVGALVDLAWMSPGPGYPDGAVLIYSDNGYLYIYEPHIGPSNIDHQKLEGDIHPGAITLIETYGGQFYALDRQANQVWKYLPVNGAYNGQPRTYFAENTAPQLQTALAMDLDGRLYLLLGDSAIYTYFLGTEDVSFRLEGIPVTDFQPTVMAIEPDPEDGMIYLGDAKQNALIAMNKRGQYQRQFRLTDESLDKLEALAVSEDPHVLYFVAANRLHAAPIPAAVNP